MDQRLSGMGPAAFNAGLEGYRNASQQMSDASRNLANGSQRQAIDVNKAAVNLTAGSVQAEASAKVMATADGMLGTIIDTFA